MFAGAAETHSTQAVLIKKLRAIGRRFPVTFSRHWVARIFSGNRSEKNCRIGDTTRHRSSRVLTVRDGNDAGAAHKSNCWFDADERVSRRRTHHRTVRLRDNRSRAKIRGDRDTRSRTRATRVTIQRVRISRLTPTSAPTTRSEEHTSELQ